MGLKISDVCFFQKMTLDQSGCSKTPFGAVFDPVLDRVEALRPQKDFKWPILGPTGVPKMAENVVFFNDEPGPFGVLKHTFRARFEAVGGPFEAPFGPQTP